MKIKYLVVITGLTLAIVIYQKNCNDYYYCESNIECIKNTLNGIQNINYANLSGSTPPLIDRNIERDIENSQYIVSGSYFGTNHFIK